LIDAWQEDAGGRKVFKFGLELVEDETGPASTAQTDLEQTRLIPTSVKLEVWKRDKGRCVQCGSKDNLHFDHIIPYSKGGSSLVAENIQVLCARHNIAKRDRIE
jgi:5-methylcytosine-specific restriction endonuclease McrA